MDASSTTLVGNRLDDLRAAVKDVRGAIHRSFQTSKPLLTGLNAIERELDRAQQALEKASPEAVDESRAALFTAQERLDWLCADVAARVRRLELAVAIWTIVVLVVTSVVGYLIWQATTSPSWFRGLEPDRWLLLRAVLLAGCGGVAGSAVDLGRVLYLTVPTRTFDPRNTLYLFCAPFLGAALAVVVSVLVRAGMLSVGSSSAPTGAVSASAFFSMGFLIGFAPASVYARIKGVVRAIFGTDEVHAPIVAPPETRAKDGRVEVSSKVTSSAATRIASVSAVVRTPAGSSATAMSQGPNSVWIGEFPRPADQALPQSTLTVEARDERGNVTRTEPISFAGVGAATPEPATTESAADTGTPRVLSTRPAAGETTDATSPLVVQFSHPMLDADPALTADTGEGIELEKQWNTEKTELTLQHVVPLAPGTYHLELQAMITAAEEELAEDLEVEFKVGPGSVTGPPAPGPPGLGEAGAAEDGAAPPPPAEG